MPDTLVDLQQTFTRCVAALISYATSAGIGLTFGDAFRSQEEAARLARVGLGIKDSVHCARLAVDFNAFVDGHYTMDPAVYEKLGVYWEGLWTLARWGGRFTRHDYGHFSFEYEGRM